MDLGIEVMSLGIRPSVFSSFFVPSLPSLALPVPKLQAAILTTQLLERVKGPGVAESGFPEEHQGTGPRRHAKQLMFTVTAL